MNNSVLDTIKTRLTEISEEYGMNGVSYGIQERDDIPEWNYFVFNRIRTKKASNGVDRQTYYQVHIVHENYIPEGFVDKVIGKLESRTEDGTKIRQTSDDIQYDYVFKGSTNLVVEIATITFVHPEKRR